MNILKSIYLFFYSSNIFRQRFLNRIVKIEGGQVYSETLRKHFIKHHCISVGAYTYGGVFNPRNVASGTVVGRYCSIAPTVYIFNKNHPYNRISQHPFFYNPSMQIVTEYNIKCSKLVIGHDVWIGEHAIITPSVTEIGIGAIVAAGAVVTKNVPNFAVVAGNPARIIRYRFDLRKQESVLNTKWWNKSIEEIKRSNLEVFLSDNF